jgi:hypothetical protein
MGEKEFRKKLLSYLKKLFENEIIITFGIETLKD